LNKPALRDRWVALHLLIGALWLLVLPWLPEARSAAAGSELKISAMLALAGWLPSVPLAIWQAKPGRRWMALVLSDLGFGLGLMVLALTLYVPLFFTAVAWFFPYALLPCGVISEGMARLMRARLRGLR
jgi:hypothetical protein